uniref:Uncharacterized protein n=1 Tax=Ammonifex degensii TaxID=42838 RepID=A0A7C1J7G9_9THEO
MKNAFYFYTQYHLVRLLGIKARNPVELLEGIRKVPASSIYYHTHRFLQQHRYLSPEPPNDFAYWLTNVLNLKELGEAFASVDTAEFKNMEELRAEFVRILTGYLSEGNHVVDCPPGQEFYFSACKTFILPVPYTAHNLKEFAKILGKISVNSLYFHVFESRMRLEKGENDFAAWFRSIGKNELAEELMRLDPYTITLEGLREKIISLVVKYAEH